MTYILHIGEHKVKVRSIELTDDTRRRQVFSRYPVMDGQKDEVIDISLVEGLCLSEDQILEIALFTDDTASHDRLCDEQRDIFLNTASKSEVEATRASRMIIRISLPISS
jgi:hypothetical protein